MSLPDIKQQRTFFDTEQIFQRLAGKSAKGAERFVFFAEEIWPRLVELRPELEAMYCLENGRPAEEPVRMAAVSILQFAKPIRMYCALFMFLMNVANQRRGIPRTLDFSCSTISLSILSIRITHGHVQNFAFATGKNFKALSLMMLMTPI